MGLAKGSTGIYGDRYFHSNGSDQGAEHRDKRKHHREQTVRKNGKILQSAKGIYHMNLTETEEKAEFDHEFAVHNKFRIKSIQQLQALSCEVLNTLKSIAKCIVYQKAAYLDQIKGLQEISQRNARQLIQVSKYLFEFE